MGQITHASAGLSRGRWNNVRSLVPAAVRRAGVRAMAGGARRPLSFPWEVVRAAIPDKTTRYGLSRFISFCSAEGIAVDAGVFERFRAALLTESFVKLPKQVYRTSCMLWNDAAGIIQGWPKLQVQVPNEKVQYSFAWDQFAPSLLED